MKNFHQKHDDLTSELFRFVSVRPPSKGRKKAQNIRYNETDLPAVRGNLYAKLCKLSGTTADVAKEQLQQILATFETSTRAIHTIAECEAAYPGFKAFYDWFQNNPSADNATVKQQLEAFLGKPVNDIANDFNNQSKIWDVYFYCVLKNTAYNIAQASTEIIRVYEIALALNNGSDDVLTSYLTASIVLPQCVASLLVLTQQTVATRPLDQQPKTISLVRSGQDIQAEIQELEKAKNALAAELDRQLVNQLSEEQDLLEVSNGLTPIQKEQMSLLTKQVVAALDIEVKVGETKINTILEAIDRAIDANYDQVFSTVESSTRYALIGNNLVEIPSEAPATVQKRSSEKSTDPDMQDIINSMYNDWWQTQKPEWLLEILVGDFLKVEQETKCYVPGEVAHIENIIKGELRRRETRRLTRSESTFESTFESEEETERDVQTTDRYEMEREVENVISTNTSVETGIDIAADYGMVQLNASAGVAFNVATQNSTSQSTAIAKEVTERARNRVIKRIKETRVSKIIKEFEDKNLHEFNNTHGDGSIGAVYRWVDKIYKNRLLNYGKRMMVKINLQEPSSYYQYSQFQNPFAEIKFPKSPDQVANETGMMQLKSHSNITPQNYKYWAKEYDAIVSVPPTPIVQVGKAYSKPIPNANWTDTPSIDQAADSDDTLVMPEGYELHGVYIRVFMKNHFGQGPDAFIMVGNSAVYFNPHAYNDNGVIKPQNQAWLTANELKFNPSDENRIIPVSIHGKNAHSFACNIVLHCKITDKAFQTWQKETFNAIMDAYRNKLAEAEYAKSQLLAESGVQIEGRNPLMNKSIIETELKRGCIEAIRVYNNPWLGHHLSTTDANTPIIKTLSSGEPYLGAPLTQAAYGKYVAFMEECFEWKNMTYHFSPYFWGQHAKWKSLINMEDNDPLFENFLKAGTASVVLPVRPGYEKLFAYHLNTGQLWFGEEVPIASELNDFIDEELGMVDPNADPDVIDCWETKLPTNLTYIQQHDGGLDETGLPCFDVKCKE